MLLNTQAENDTVVVLELTGSASAGTDFTGSTTLTVTIPGGFNSASTTVDVTDDTLVESTESIVATIISSTVTGNITNGPTTAATVSIEDNDGALASIPTSISVDENNNALVTITLSNPSDSPTTVDYSATAAAATSVDFDDSSGSVVIPTGAQTGVITVAITDDTIVEETEDFTVELTGASGGPGVDVATASLTTVDIIDNDSATVTTTASTATVAEGTSTASVNDVTFTIAQSAEASTDSLITYTIEGTGANPADTTDYTPNAGSVIISAGQTEATVVVSIAADSDVEPNETFQMVLTTITGDADVSLAGSPAVVTIDDDDASEASIPGNITVNESAGEVVVTVSLTNPAASNLTLDYNASLGSASAADFDGGTIPSGTLVVPAGSTTYPLTIALENDAIVEDDETFNVTISNPQGAGVVVDGLADVAVVTIDSEDQALLRVLTASGSPAEDFNEGDSTATSDLFFLSLSNPASTPTTITYAVGGDATEGDDYVAIPTVTVVPAGTQSFNIPVTVNGDTLVENDETIQLSLSSSSNPDVLIGPSLNDVAEATLLNDDGTAVVSVSTATDTITEGDTGTTDVVYTISLSAPVGADTVIDYSLVGSMGGTSTEGFFGDGDEPAPVFKDADTAFGAGSLTMTTGQTEAFVTVAVKGDEVLESDESFYLSLTSVTGVDPIDATSVTPVSVTVEDDDTSNLVIVGDENGNEEGPINGRFRLILTNPTDKPVKVEIDDEFDTVLNNDEAQVGVDFEALGSATIATIPAGTNALPISVTIIDDADVEEAEKVKYQAISIDPADTYGGDLSLVAGSDEAFITIIDNDAVTVSVLDATVLEDSDAEVTLSLSETVTKDVTVTYTTNDDTATAPADYTSTTSSAVISAGESTAVITIDVIDDNVSEIGNGSVVPEEFFQVSLSGTSSDGVLTTTSGTDGTVTIQDNDFLNAVVDVAGSSVVEGDDAVVSVEFNSLGVVSDKDVTVTLGFLPGTTPAASTDDYTPSAATITAVIPALSSSVDVTVATADTDSLVEGAENLLVTISSISSADTNVIAGLAGDVEIIDDTPFTVDISTGVTSVGESGADVPVTVSIDQAATNSLTINLGASGTADTADYSLVPSSVVIEPGQSSVTFAIDPTVDSVNEADENLILSVDSISGVDSSAVTGLGDSIDVTIIDEDTPEVSVEFTPGTVEEGFATSLVISLDKAATDDFTLTYGVGGSASITSDYTGDLTGTIEISTGATEAIIPVTIVDDNAAEVQETIEVSLSGIDSTAALAAEIGSPDTATVTIIDNDDPLLTVSKLMDATDPEGGDGSGSGTDGVFLINLSSPVSQPTTVTYSIGGTATDGDTLDYTLGTSTAIISAGEQNAYITITPSDDGWVELDQTVDITLTDFTNTGSEPISIVDTGDEFATLTIFDEDTATVSIGFTDADGSVTEGDSFDMAISVSKPTEGVVLDLTDVTLSPQTGTTLADTDLPASVTVASGATDQTLTVNTTSDTIVELDETLNLTVAVDSAIDYGGRVAFVDTDVPADGTIDDVSDSIVIVDNDTFGVVGTPLVNSSADAQRSRVTELEIVFNGEVAGSELAEISVINRDTLASVDISTSTFNYDPSTGLTTVLLKFSGSEAEFGSLKDGNYELTVNAALEDSLGNTLGSDLVFGDSAGDNFYRLYGDSNGDRMIDANDYFAFLAVFGGSSDAFDFDDSSTVDATDYFAFLARFGSNLPF